MHSSVFVLLVHANNISCVAFPKAILIAFKLYAFGWKTLHKIA